MKIRIRLLGTLLAVSLLAGCGGSAQSYDMASTESMKAMAATEEYAEAESAATNDMAAMDTAGGIETNTDISQTAQVNRKLIRTFHIQIQTKEFDEVVEGIQAKVQELGGYIENSSLDSGSSYYSNYNRYSYITVRIPSDKLDGFVDNVKETSNVTSISESTEDITLNYVDVESRKIALETERDRLLELLEKAETVEDIITIESRLSEVRYQLESYTSQLRTYDNQVDYSTVYIDISEVDRETKVEPKTFWEEVTEDFGDSLYGLGQGFRGFAIWFLGSSPYLILWAVIIGAVVFAVRTIGKKRRLKKTLQNIKPEEQEMTEEDTTK